MMTRTDAPRTVCRSCGFSDCPSADLGYCPRWQDGPELAPLLAVSAFLLTLINA